MNRIHRILGGAVVGISLAASLSISASAQYSGPPTGMMLGSTIQDRLRGRNNNDRNRNDRNMRPDEFRKYDRSPVWTGGVRFIPGSNYGGYNSGCDQPVIIVNSSPMYIPGYYAGINGYSSYSYGSGLAAQASRFSAGYSVATDSNGVSRGTVSNAAASTTCTPK